MSRARNEPTGYTMGYGDQWRQVLDRRSAASNAAYLLPYLEPGTRRLDFGCGPGSISIGLAQAVSPGKFSASISKRHRSIWPAPPLGRPD